MGRRMCERENKVSRCPHCGSRNTNRVDINYFCSDCFIEYNPKNGSIFHITVDGNLIPYNEFMDCG